MTIFITRNQRFLKLLIKILLFSVALTPLIVTWRGIFPYVFGKLIFFRGFIEIALILFLILILLELKKSPMRSDVPNIESRSRWTSDLSTLSPLVNYQLPITHLLKNPLCLSLAAFFLSIIVSTIFATNPYRSFWGDLERGEGLFGIIHYLIFMILAVIIFENKDWLIFFKISLFITTPLIIIYAFLQYFSIDIPYDLFPLYPTNRPGSFLGNATFLASYLIFVLIFAFILFFQKNQSIFWRFSNSIIIIASLVTIFMTRGRGVILGLTISFFWLLFYFIFLKKNIFFRQMSFIVLAVIIIVIGIFLLTKENVFWQNIPGFDRLATTKIFDKSDTSTRMRLLAWQISWQAFREKPLFGWGPDNYLIAYEKYYNPEMTLYGETWLDRSHNKILDILVMQGILGLLTYLGIFAAIFRLLIKQLKTSQSDELTAAPFICAGLIAYFVQNLTLFDHISSYLMFFAVVGYLIFQEENKLSIIGNH